MKRNKLLFTAAILALVSTMGFIGCSSGSDDNTTTVAVTGVTLSDSTINLVKGTTKTLVATITPEDATEKTLNWTSSDSSKVYVDADGVVTAVDVTTSAVTVTVTTLDGAFSAACAVNVSATAVPITAISIDDTATAEAEDTLTLTATVTPTTTTESVAWTSSDDSIATVSSRGVVTTYGAGDVTITAKNPDGTISDTCALTVSATRMSYLYKADGTSDINPTIQSWAGAVSEYTADTTYPYALTSAFKNWGACIACQFTASQLVSYKRLAFDVKIAGGTSLIAQVSSGEDKQYTQTVTADTWTHVVVPITSNFTNYKTATQMAVMSKTSGTTIYVTNVKLVGNNSEYDATALTAAVTAAQTKCDAAAAKEGTTPGKYLAADVATYQTAITAAQGHEADTAQATIVSALETLNAATAALATIPAIPTALPATKSATAAKYIYYATDTNITGDAATVTDMSQSWWSGFATTNYDVSDKSTPATATTTTVKKLAFGDAAGACGAWAGANSWTVTSGYLPYLHMDVYLASDSFKIKPVDSTGPGVEMTVTLSDYTTDANGWYTIDIPLTNSAFNDYSFKQLGFISTVASDVIYIDNVYTYEVDNSTAQLAAAKTALSTEITTAQTLHDGATEGTEVGNYATGSMATLQAAIDAATTVLNGGSTTLADYTDATTTLTAAVTAFKATKVVGSVPEWTFTPDCAVGGAWIHLTAAWTSATYAVAESDLITTGMKIDTDAYTGAVGTTTTTSSSITWGLNFADASFLTETSHVLSFKMTWNSKTWNVAVTFTGKSAKDSSPFTVTNTSITEAN
jgi:hypothetical protein